MFACDILLLLVYIACSLYSSCTIIWERDLLHSRLLSPGCGHTFPKSDVGQSDYRSPKKSQIVQPSPIVMYLRLLHIGLACWFRSTVCPAPLSPAPNTINSINPLFAVVHRFLTSRLHLLRFELILTFSLPIHKYNFL